MCLLLHCENIKKHIVLVLSLVFIEFHHFVFIRLKLSRKQLLKFISVSAGVSAAAT